MDPCSPSKSPKYWSTSTIPRKLNSAQQFEICIGAILTQNTTWKNVEKALINLFQSHLLDPLKILEVPMEQLAGHIKPTGYYNQKAKKLKAFASYVKNLDYLGVLLQKDISALRVELLSIFGIGPETADDIILYAAQQPVFVVDTYTKRLMHRLGFCLEDIKYHPLQKLISENLPQDLEIYNEMHALIVSLAKEHCQKKPICINCPLARQYPTNNEKESS